MIQSLDFDTILKNSFRQFKRVWFRSLITSAISFAILFVVFLLEFVFFGAILFVVYKINESAFTILFFIFLFISIFILLYVFFLSYLAYIKVTTAENEEIWPFQAFSEVKPIAFGFFAYNVLFGLFIIGLLPYSFIFLFIPVVLWFVWGSLAYYVYLNEPDMRHGLFPAYKSRALIKDYFWSILLIVIIFIGLDFVAFFYLSDAGDLGSFLYDLSTVFLWIFKTIFFSETYKKLKQIKERKQPVEIRRPVISIVISVLMWIFIIYAVVVLIPQYINQNPQVLQSTFEWILKKIQEE